MTAADSFAVLRPKGEARLGEIARWARFSDAERDMVMATLPARIEGLKAAGKLG